MNRSRDSELSSTHTQYDRTIAQLAAVMYMLRDKYEHKNDYDKNVFANKGREKQVTTIITLS